MKRVALTLISVVSVSLLCGCYINKKGRICSLTMPAYFCDREARDLLMSEDKMIDGWGLGGRTESVRLTDWVECGGTWDGGYGLLNLPNGEYRTTEQIQTESRALFYQIQRCMLKKGYDYVGQCYDSDVSRAQPACRARAGKPWE